MSPSPWRIGRAHGVEIARCELPDVVGPWIHGFTTRRAERGADRDLSLPAADRARPDGPRARLLRALELDGARLVEVRQVHGGRVVHGARTSPTDEADAIVVTRDDGPLVAAVRTADCVPILLADRVGVAAAAVHAGWRGVVAEVVPRAIAVLGALGVGPDRLEAMIGPAIGGCCYEVAEDCAAAIARATAQPLEPPSRDGGRPRVDLRRAVSGQLEAAGVSRWRIHVAPWCTRCSPDLWFSYRRDGDRAGRMLAFIGPRAHPAVP